MWMNEGYVQRFYKFEGRTPWDVRKRFYDIHLDHRVGPVKDFPRGGGDISDTISGTSPGISQWSESGCRNAD